MATASSRPAALEFMQRRQHDPALFCRQRVARSAATTRPTAKLDQPHGSSRAIDTCAFERKRSGNDRLPLWMLPRTVRIRRSLQVGGR